MFFDGWSDLVQIALKAVMSYAFLILLLRVTGKRTLSQMNAFDFIVTVAIGSTFAATLLNASVSATEGFAAFTALVLLQAAVAWASAHSSSVESIVKSVPTVLVWEGRVLDEVLRRERVTEAEVLAACRAAGVLSVGQVQALVLETAGTFSVLERRERPLSGAHTLRTVSRVPSEFE